MKENKTETNHKGAQCEPWAMSSLVSTLKSHNFYDRPLHSAHSAWSQAARKESLFSNPALEWHVALNLGICCSLPTTLEREDGTGHSRDCYLTVREKM